VITTAQGIPLSLSLSVYVSFSFFFFCFSFLAHNLLVLLAHTASSLILTFLSPVVGENTNNGTTARI
jgi:hypothetical protein